MCHTHAQLTFWYCAEQKYRGTYQVNNRINWIRSTVLHAQSSESRSVSFSFVSTQVSLGIGSAIPSPPLFLVICTFLRLSPFRALRNTHSTPPISYLHLEHSNVINLAVIEVLQNRVCRNDRRQSVFLIQAQFHSYCWRKLRNTFAGNVDRGRHSKHVLWISATDLWWSILFWFPRSRDCPWPVYQDMWQLVRWNYLSLLPDCIEIAILFRCRVQRQWSFSPQGKTD